MVHVSRQGGWVDFTADDQAVTLRVRGEEARLLFAEVRDGTPLGKHIGVLGITEGVPGQFYLYSRHQPDDLALTGSEVVNLILRINGGVFHELVQEAEMDAITEHVPA